MIAWKQEKSLLFGSLVFMSSRGSMLSWVAHEKPVSLLVMTFVVFWYFFANSLDPDQDQHSVGPDLDPNRLTLW